MKQTSWSRSSRLLELQDPATTGSQENTHWATQQMSKEPKGSQTRPVDVIQHDAKEQTVGKKQTSPPLPFQSFDLLDGVLLNLF